MKTTSLYHEHQNLGAVMVDFAGWQMPLHYGSQIQEHQTVRQSVGMFDVSHMGIILIEGKEANPFLRYLLANDVNKLHSGKALYTCLLNKQGGILDDLIVYCLQETFFYLVVNAATTEKDHHWIKQQAQAFDVSVSLDESMGILAIQGPMVWEKVEAVFKALKPFHFIQSGEKLIARTGYTGEEGVEILLPKKDLPLLWQQMTAAKVKPIGLGARDTLRLEAGLNLYGHEMDEKVSPLECNLAWTVDWQDDTRNFIGKAALRAQKRQGLTSQLVGLVLLEKGICRVGMPCWVSKSAKNYPGTITSGSFSPTLERGIAIARVPIGDFVEGSIEIRSKKIPVQVISLPFLRKGKPTFTVEAKR